MEETSTTGPSTVSWKDKLLALTSSFDAKAEAKKYKLDKLQYFAVLGIAISGLAAFINTYNAISNINDNMMKCATTSDLGKELTTQFIIMLIISIIILIIGIIFMYVFRDSSGFMKIIALSTITLGVFGIIYSASIKLQSLTNTVKLWISWLVFIGFIIFGLLVRNKHTGVAVKE